MALDKRRPTTAFILSMIGGVLMIINGGMMFMLFMNGLYGYGGIGGMMGGYQGMMGSFGIPFGFMSSLMLVGLIAGIIVVVGAVMLDARPAEHWAWGVIILVFSVISFLGMGGFFIGAILGIIGGAFAVSWR
jgi:hypothetical protein